MSDRYCCAGRGIPMAAETDTPVVDFTNGISNDMATAMSRSLGEISGVIRGGVRAALVKGQDGHLASRPTIQGRPSLRGDMALLTREMFRNATSRRSLLERSTTCLVTRIGMAELTLSNQGMGIARMMYDARGCRMTDRAQATAVIGTCPSSEHDGDAPLKGCGHGNQDALQVGIKGMAGTTRVMHFSITDTDRCPRGSTDSRGMASDTDSAGADNHGRMVRGSMTAYTVITGGGRGIMMDPTRWIGRDWMTGQTSCR